MKHLIIGIFIGFLTVAGLYITTAIANDSANELLDETVNQYCSAQVSYGFQFNSNRCPWNYVMTGKTNTGIICSTLTINCFRD